MKGILLLNGQPYEGKIDAENATVYCCDGAYDWAKDKIKIDKNIGDYDSLPYIPTPPPEKIYPSEKDSTDGEIAVLKMLKDGIDEIEIYGGGGRREDHFLGNLHLLYLAFKEGAAVKMITENSLIFLGSGRIFLGEYVGRTLSVLPFGGEIHIMESAGLKYAYPDRLIYGTSRGISNIVQSGDAQLTVKKGDVALIIINRGEV